jgi:hypothetical protein
MYVLQHLRFEKRDACEADRTDQPNLDVGVVGSVDDDGSNPVIEKVGVIDAFVAGLQLLAQPEINVLKMRLQQSPIRASQLRNKVIVRACALRNRLCICHSLGAAAVPGSAG